MDFRRSVPTALLTLVVVLLAGCGSGRPSPASSPVATAAGWPEALDDFTMVWTAEPAIDVTRWPAVVARAYTESYLLATIMGQEKYLYPGFDQAIDPTAPQGHRANTRYLRPTVAHSIGALWVGSEQAHILSVTTSGRAVAVVICEYMFGNAEPGPLGQFRTHVAVPPPYAGVEESRITMTAPAQPEPQMPDQRGPARAPTVDVFNGWKVNSHEGGYFATVDMPPEWPDWQADREACVGRAPPHHDDLIRGGEYPRSYFPTLPAVPGWPAAVPTWR